MTTKSPKKLNSEILMIPSSPDITLEEQEYIVDCINQFVFCNETKYKINLINDKNIELLQNFIINTANKSETFRYFKNRDTSVIKAHLLTVILTNSEGESIGYGHIDVDDKNWFGICIAENYRNKGLGYKLMDYILDNNKIKNLEEIYLTVDTDNLQAIALYKKFNFNEIETTQRHIKMVKIN